DSRTNRTTNAAVSQRKGKLVHRTQI
ncbi:hypothetical protein GWI33_014023, partial [Rhynchophorus ferrugineus]